MSSKYNTLSAHAIHVLLLLVTVPIRGSYRIYSLGGKLKTFGVNVMGVHKQVPSKGVWSPPPPPDFCLQNRCSQIDSDTDASCHRIYTIVIREANHRLIAHGQNILD